MLKSMTVQGKISFPFDTTHQNILHSITLPVLRVYRQQDRNTAEKCYLLARLTHSLAQSCTCTGSRERQQETCSRHTAVLLKSNDCYPSQYLWCVYASTEFTQDALTLNYTNILLMYGNNATYTQIPILKSLNCTEVPKCWIS